MKKITLLMVATALTVLLAAAPAQAATFTVNATHDAVDTTPGDGQCDSAPTQGSQCTLRAAALSPPLFASASLTIRH
jgi:hypothetical protein